MEPQTRSGGSQVPCAVPLAWRLARIDTEFGVSAAQAASAVAQAAAMWEDRTGRTLFRHDPDDGFPIRLVYDERQARADDRSRREGELADERGRLDAEGEALKRQGDRHAAARARHNERRRALDERVDEHNADVRAWNERGDVPPDVAERLESASRSLEEERAALEDGLRTLQDELRALQDGVDRINRANAEHARRSEALGRAFPSGTTEAGEYREAVRMQGGRVEAVGREIRVYRFGSTDELELIVAHELGHALGLGHLEEPRAVMSAAHDAEPKGTGATAVHAADLDLLRSTCPSLGGPGR
jgi:Skp family chaperone for outer membrane proteins